MNFIKLVHCKINVEEIAELVKSPECGAVSFFMGTTRNTFDGKEVFTFIIMNSIYLVYYVFFIIFSFKKL